ncbi:MAG: Rrf2 family transcriptional regulator [Bacteroidales bacterium]|nr:MAG: Rrf2 family transcriptional regulator [Bacteroidales bacterium]
MKVNTRIRYGIRAMIEIAKNNNGTGIFQKDISKNQEISNKYLDHIINGLKVAQLIRKKSKKEGYVLTRNPSEITIYDINNAFEPGINIIECIEDGMYCNREDKCEVQEFWRNLNDLITTHYKSVTLEDLLKKNLSY